MKKDASYSIRLSTFVLQALRRAAKRDRRTVASLLEKIIFDYLEKEGFLPLSEIAGEHLKFRRKKLILPANTLVYLESNAESHPGCDP